MKKKLVSVLMTIMILVAFIPIVSLGAQNEFDSQEVQTEDSEEPSESSVMNSEKDSTVFDEETGDLTDISSMTLKLSKAKWVYTGVPITPDATIDGLVKNQDYKLSYVDNNKIGTATVIATGIGNYFGEASTTFSIVETSISTVKCSPGSVIYVKGSFQISPTIINPSGKTTYISSASSIATVTTTGKVTGLKAGKCTITVKNNNKTYKINVTVNNPKLNKTSVSLRLNTTATLSVTGKIGTASFKSSNTKIATVSSSGVITAKKPGKCTITVISNGVTLNCVVTVTKPVLSASSVVVYNSDTYKLSVLGGKGKIKWKSSKKKVAKVSSKGTIKAKKAGKCTITVKRGKYKMKCKVVVPSHYEGYSIPDFGAKFGKTGRYSYEDEMNCMTYKAKKSYIKKYRKVLKKKGFSLFEKSGGVYSYVNDEFDFVAFAYKKGRITVVYLNLWDNLEFEDDSDYDDSYYDDSYYDDLYYDEWNDYDDVFYE